MKYGVIEQMRQQYPVPPMCRFLGVSISGYYAWRKRPLSLHDQQEPRLEAQVRAAHERTRETFGAERLQKELSSCGVQIGVHRIKRLRTKLGLRCKQKRKFKATTNSTHDLPVAPNILSQDFSVSAPNQAWCGDITYIATDEGWLYLAGLKDLYSGEIVGYAMSERMTKQLVMQALFRAVASHRPPPGLIQHTDRGSQYCAHAYQKLLKQFGMQLINEQTWKLFRQRAYRIVLGLTEKRFCLSSQIRDSRPSHQRNRGIHRDLLQPAAHTRASELFVAGRFHAAIPFE